MSKICGNCGTSLGTGDKYCRRCGTKAGVGKYKPRLDSMQCIYGPAPEKRNYKCVSCGYKWNTVAMFYDKYCPQCGKPIEKEKKTNNKEFDLNGII